MIRTRKELETAEAAMLAPFAQKSGDSRGRIYQKRKHPTRNEYQCDRARIIHSRAFRRHEFIDPLRRSVKFDAATLLALDSREPASAQGRPPFS